MSVVLAFAVSSLLPLQFAPAAEEIARIDGFYDTFPSINDDVPRPRNLRPLAFGATASAPIFTVTRGDNSVVIAEALELDVVLENGFSENRTFAVTLPTLNAGEDVQLEVACDGCFTDGTFAFRIGDEVDDRAPVFREVAGSFGVATGIGGTVGLLRSGFEVEVCLPGLVEPEDVMLHVSGTDLATPVISRAEQGCSIGTDRLGVHLLIDGGAERDLCIDVVAIDVAGHESAPITVCGQLDDPVDDCASTPMPPPVAALGLALLARRRRR